MDAFKSFLISIIFLGLIGCNHTDLGPAQVPSDYEESIREWQEYRIDRLTEPTGWLRTADLIWLEEGENRFGSGPDTDTRFPEGTIPDYAGIFTLNGGNVHMRVDNDVTITHKGEPVSEIVLFGEGAPDERTKVMHQDLIWFIDQRGDHYGIRLFNQDNPKADEFDGFPAYPLDESWHLNARFIPYEEERSITLDNVIGNRIERPTPGRLEFRIDGNIYSLDAFESGDNLFLMFGDETNRDETYQAGRYIMVDQPDENGNTVIDFNRAYNMPCAFNKFTTCQLPPPQNRLDVAITAGEKRPVEWEGL